MGRLPMILARGLVMKTESPIVRMSQAVDWERVDMDMWREAEMGMKPGPSMGP